MRKFILCLALLLSAVGGSLRATVENNPTVLQNLLNRIGGEDTADRFSLVVDDGLAQDGKDVFVLTADNGKPCIKGNTVLSVATGINWYLNHYAHVNLAWNNLTTDLTTVSLPLPASPETHTCVADYRYYLNYCTFSYSMSTWTWERWQKEIDWMALHGINMPLQIVGLDVVWYNLLTKDLGFTKEQANAFVAGPSFQAWWGMNNLEGWGGPNPDWWYTRQQQLATQILERMRALGMEPVLPGYAGMVPSKSGDHGLTAQDQGGWCGFTRPYILNPNSTAFTEVAAKYYARLKEVMGTSSYYSMDPFHEGANTSGIDVPRAYAAIATAMETANPNGKWVIQYWQWNGAQYNVLDKVEKGKLIVLDLFSDAHTHFGDYKGHDAVYCMLHNFGGRTGFYGRLNGIIDGYFKAKSSYANVKGIGATPEAIETVPVLYDALFELPWREVKPDAATWLADYTVARYGASNDKAKEAWEKLRNSSLNCQSDLQGPMEAVICARPSLTVDRVSSWGGTSIFYDVQEVAVAAQLLMESGLSGANYDYDLTDLARQALTDYAYYLLKAMNAAYSGGQTAAFETARDAFLGLIADLDDLLGTNENFRLGRWTNMARAIADEVEGTTTTDKNWLELDNARRLITTWGDQGQANGGGLRDYSYREWNGMLKDYYLPRWQQYFNNGLAGRDWFAVEDAWVKNSTLSYSATASGDTKTKAQELFGKYFLSMQKADGKPYVLYRKFEQNLNDVLVYSAYRGQDFTLPVITRPDGVTATLSVDSNNDGVFAEDETVPALTCTIPTTALTGNVPARLTLNDGTEARFTLTLKDEITTARTVTVASADAEQGTVAITGADGALSVTNTEYVELVATPAAGYDFLNWTDGNGEKVSTQNPYTYYGKEAADFTANFIINKWTMPPLNTSELGTIESYEQYVTSIKMIQNGRDAVELYSTNSCPSTLFQTTNVMNAPAGSRFTLSWKDTESKDGLAYCRLSAYIDLNSDGDFSDEGELLAVVGNANASNNTQLCDGSLDVLLPYDVPLGLTHLRLRFDGSYTGGWDAVTGAKPANAETVRMVYDVLVNVTQSADYACTVGAKSSDDNRGTADTNGNSNPYAATKGSEIILRANPASGYEVVKWTDAYGRDLPSAWMAGNTISFYPIEDATYTAVFKRSLPATITVGGWEFSHSRPANGEMLTLTEVKSGSGALTIPATYEVDGMAYPIVALAPGLLSGKDELTALSLPATLSEAGAGVTHTLDERSWLGADGKAQAFALMETLSGSEPWTMYAHIVNGGTSYNQWGSGLLATGSDALAPSYQNGFQFYLKADGTLLVKCNGSQESSFTNKPGSAFDLQVANGGAGKVHVTLCTSDGKVETKTLATTLADITQISSAIPTGTSVSDFWVRQENAPSYRTGLSGSGVQNAPLVLPRALKGADAWTLRAHVTTDGSAFNTWGSSVLATGTNCFANDFTGGFQFYLAKAGTLTLKVNGAGENRFDASVGSAFDIDMAYTPGDKVSVTLTTEGGTVETKTFSGITFNDIDAFVTGIPSGIDVSTEYVVGADLLCYGCPKLASIAVDADNAHYTVADGGLYDSGKKHLIHYPAASTARTHTLPATATRIDCAALNGATHLERVVAAEAGGLEEVGLGAFAGTTARLQVTAAQATAGVGRLEAPRMVSAPVGQTVDAPQDASLNVVEVCATSASTGAFTTDVPNATRWLTYTFEAGKGAALCFPAGVTALVTTAADGSAATLSPETAFTYYSYSDGAFSEVSATGWTTIPAGVYVLLPKAETTAGKTVTFRIDGTAGDTPAGVWLGNASVAATPASDAYAFSPDKSVFLPADAVTPLSAYRTSTAGEAALPFLLSGTVTLNDGDATYTAPAAPINDVTLNRKFHGGEMWNTVCLPFTLSEQQTQTYFTAVKQLGSVTKNGDNFVLNFVNAERMEAGKPYIVLVDATRESTEIPGAYFEAETPASVALTPLTQDGTFVPVRLANNEYFISANTFYYATSAAPVTMKGFRFCIKLDDGETLVKQAAIAIDGVLTGLDEVEGATADDEVSVYTVSGVKLRSGVRRSEALRGLPKGLYIVGGQKQTN